MTSGKWQHLFTCNVYYVYAFLRDKDSRERTSLSFADRRVCPRRLRFGGMRAPGLRFLLGRLDVLIRVYFCI